MDPTAQYPKEVIEADRREWDAKVLRGDYHATVTVEYAVSTKNGQWKELEEAVKARPLDDEWARSIVDEYAQRVLGGRWESEEDRLKGSAWHLLDYANRVMKGRLPNDFHDEMVRYEILQCGNEYTRQYWARYGPASSSP
jgi:hypothetical protein